MSALPPHGRCRSCDKPMFGRADQVWCSPACRKRGNRARQRTGVIDVAVDRVALEEHLIGAGLLAEKDRDDTRAVQAALAKWLYSAS